MDGFVEKTQPNEDDLFEVCLLACLMKHKFENYSFLPHIKPVGDTNSVGISSYESSSSPKCSTCKEIFENMSSSDTKLEKIIDFNQSSKDSRYNDSGSLVNQADSPSLYWDQVD